MTACEAQVSVRYAETDQMRVAHHSNYIVWFELARVKLLKTFGIEIDRLEEKGYFIPVLEVTAKYLRPARFGDRLTIRAELREQTRAKLTFGYDVLNESGEILCKGYSLHGFMNRDGKAVKPPKEFKEIKTL